MTAMGRPSKKTRWPCADAGNVTSVESFGITCAGSESTETVGVGLGAGADGEATPGVTGAATPAPATTGAATTGAATEGAAWGRSLRGGGRSGDGGLRRAS